MYKISSPLSVPVSKKKKFILNLNVYRNAHYMTLNKAKVAYTDIMLPVLEPLPKFKRVVIKYVFYPGTNGRHDIDNVCCIHAKFFADALVKAGKLEDDNQNFIKWSIFCFGSVDKENPRVEILIKEI